MKLKLKTRFPLLVATIAVAVVAMLGVGPSPAQALMKCNQRLMAYYGEEALAYEQLAGTDKEEADAALSRGETERYDFFMRMYWGDSATSNEYWHYYSEVWMGCMAGGGG